MEKLIVEPFDTYDYDSMKMAATCSGGSAAEDDSGGLVWCSDSYDSIADAIKDSAEHRGGFCLRDDDENIVAYVVGVHWGLGGARKHGSFSSLVEAQLNKKTAVWAVTAGYISSGLKDRREDVLLAFASYFSEWCRAYKTVFCAPAVTKLRTGDFKNGCRLELGGVLKEDVLDVFIVSDKDSTWALKDIISDASNAESTMAEAMCERITAPFGWSTRMLPTCRAMGGTTLGIARGVIIRMAHETTYEAHIRANYIAVHSVNLCRLAKVYGVTIEQSYRYATRRLPAIALLKVLDPRCADTERYKKRGFYDVYISAISMANRVSREKMLQCLAESAGDADKLMDLIHGCRERTGISGRSREKGVSEESRKIINGDMETIQRAWAGLVQIGHNVPCPRVIIETCKNHGVGEYLTQEAWKQEYNFKKCLGYLIMLQRFQDELCIDIQVMCAKLQIDIGRVIRGMQYDLDVDTERIMWMFERMAKEIVDGKTAFDLAAEAGVGPKMLIRSFSTKSGGLSKDEMGRALAVRKLVEKRYKQSQKYSGQRLDGLGTRMRRVRYQNT